MIEMGHDPDWVMRAQGRNQLVGDPLWQSNGHARRQADGLDARDLAQASDQPLQLRGGHDQRITTTDDHVADLWVRVQVLERRTKLGQRASAATGPDEPTARAKAAVDRA